MTPEKEDKLIKRFPTIFRDAGKPPNQSCMAFGMEVGDGWFDLIWDLCEELEKVDPTAYALQVKEKFGGLRFYIQGEVEGVYEVENRYENMSFEVCEVCGEKGKLRGVGWWKTLCEEHNDE